MIHIEGNLYKDYLWLYEM